MNQKPSKGNKNSENSQATFTHGSENLKKTSTKSHPKKLSHQKPPDVMNITNGMQRLHLDSQQYPHSHSPKLAPVAPKNTSSNPLSSKVDTFGKNGLYAGAGFDRSPEASSLPIPKFASKTNLPSSSLSSSVPSPISGKSINIEDLFQSAGQSSQKTYIPQASPNLEKLTRNDTENLRRKSQTLMKILDASCSNQRVASPLVREKGPIPPTEDLEEMTAQVRRLLNL